MNKNLPKRKKFYLGTEIATGDQLEKIDPSIYDRIYLGNPYCLDFKGNLLLDFKNLSEAISTVNNLGAFPIVSLIAMPNNDKLPLFDKIIDVCIDAGVKGFEIHSAGSLYRLSKNKRTSDCDIIVGGFANVYNRRTAALFREMSATLMMPNFELPIQAIDSIADAVEVPLELLVHGKIPLGLSESCLLVEKSKDLGTSCPDSCINGAWLSFNRWSLKSFGKLTCSGKDLCLLPQLDDLWMRGYRNFRISGLTEDGQTLNKIGVIYKKKLQNLNDKKNPEYESFIGKLKKYSRYGLCNGFIFGKSGCEWIEFET